MPFKKVIAAVTIIAGANAIADSQSHSHHSSANAAGHAPIGVMGDHMHKKGEWMVSFRTMRMTMEGNIQGDDSISPTEIATTVPNTFFGNPMMPPTLRVVPVKMTTDMQMLGLMYAPSDRVTLMLMANYIEKEMDHTTYQGGMGTTVLGNFTTKVSGLGDTKLGALIGLYEQGSHKLHANLGLSIPTGKLDAESTVLTPTGATPTLRLPYAMQLGSGTYDIEPGLTYNGAADQLSWGAQVKLTIRTGDNDEGYTLGDQQQLSGWLAYSLTNNVSVSGRLLFVDGDAIDGSDARIMAPVQTADPNNYGGERSDFAFGVNYMANSGHRLALEYQTTFDQDANGVQMEMDDMLTLGYQYAF